MHTWWWWYYCMCGLLLIGRCLGSVVGMGWKKEGSNRTTDDKLWVQGPLETVWVRGNCPLKLWEGSQAKILSAISAIEPISTSVQNYEWLCWEKRMEPLLVAWNLFWWHRILFIFLLLFNTSQQRHKQLTSLASWQTGTACKDVENEIIFVNCLCFLALLLKCKHPAHILGLTVCWKCEKKQSTKGQHHNKLTQEKLWKQSKCFAHWNMLLDAWDLETSSLREDAHQMDQQQICMCRWTSEKTRHMAFWHNTLLSRSVNVVQAPCCARPNSVAN